MAERLLDTLIVRYLFKTDTKALDGIEKRVEGVQRRLNAASRGFTIAGGVLTGALFGVGRTVLEFETQMNNLKAVLNANETDMESLRNQAKEFGRTTAFSASQAAEAQTKLGQAGLNTKEIMEALPGVLSLAAAGNLSLDEAAGIVTSQLAAFNLPASEAGRVSDILAKAAASAKTTVREMGVGFRQAAPLASQLGVPIEEVGAMLAVLQDNGLKAETAGVGVRNMMTRLLNPTKEVKDALEKLGVKESEVTDLLNQGRLADAIKLLSDRGMDAATAAQLFGAETVGAALIIGGNSDKIDEMTTALEGSAGEARRMADTQMEGLPGAVKELKSAFEGAQIALGDAGITGALEKAADAARNALTWFTSLDEGTMRVFVGALLAGPALLGVGAALKGVSFALGGLVPLLRVLRGGLALLLSPFGLVAAVAVGAVYLIYRYWDGVVAFFQGVWAGIKKSFPGAAAFFEKLWKDIDKPVAGMFKWVREAWQTTLNWLSGPSGEESPFEWLMRPINGLFSWVTEQWNAAKAVIGTAATGTWAWLSAGAPGTFDWLTGQWAAAKAIIGTAAVGVWGWLSAGTPGVFNWLADQWEVAKLAISTAAPHIWGWLSAGAANVFQWVKDAWNAALQWISVAAPSAWVWLSTGSANVFAWIGTQWKAAKDTIKTAAPAIWNWLSTGIAGVFDWLGTQWDAALDGEGWARKLYDNLYGAIIGTNFAAIGKTIGVAIGNALGWAAAELPELVSRMTATVGGLDFAKIGGTIGKTISDFVVNRIAGLQNLVTELTAKVSGLDFKKVGGAIGHAVGIAAVAGIAGLTGLLGEMTTAVAAIDFSNIGSTIGSAILAALVVAAASMTGFLDKITATVQGIDFGNVGKIIGNAIRAAVLAVVDFIGGLFKAAQDSTKNTPWWKIALDLGLSILRALGSIFLGIGDLMLGIIEGIFGDIDWWKLVPSWAEPFVRRVVGADKKDEPDGGRPPGGFDQEGLFARLQNRLAAQNAGVPALAAAGVAGGSTVVTRNTSVTTGDINISVPSGDPETIARGVGSALSDQLHNTVEEFSTGRAR